MNTHPSESTGNTAATDSVSIDRSEPEAPAAAPQNPVALPAITTYRDTRPEERARVIEAIKKARKRQKNRCVVEPTYVHVRVLRRVGAQAIIISVEDPTAWPQCVSDRFVRGMLDSGAWIPVAEEPVAAVRLSDRLTTVQRRRRDNRMKLIAPVVELGDQMFDEEALSTAISAAATAGKVDRDTVMRVVRLYFQGGLTAAAVATRWRSGARRVLGRVEALAGTLRPNFGRPRLDGKPSFHPTELDVAKIVRGAARYYHTPRGGDWRTAWLLTIADSFLALDVSKPLEAQLKNHGGDSYPSLVQFRYWAKTDKMIVQRLRKRIGTRRFNLERRPLSGRTESKANGPGAVFQIDATRLDVVCVHQVSRRPIGRLTLYLVVDAWSHMVVGFHITLANPGYEAAVLALLSCAQDKVKLCADAEVPIKENDWPVSCLPAELRGDSEIASLQYHRLAEAGLFKVTITPAYRADLKGLVEASIGAVTKKIHSIPGRSDGHRYRCEGNPDDLAVADILQLRRYVIDWILQYNNRPLPDYALTADMIAAGMTTATPRTLWNWGIQNIIGCHRVYDPEMLKRLCLPRAKAVIGRRGLEHTGLYYVPKGDTVPEFEAWRVGALQPPTDLQVSYNPECVRELWLHVGDQMVELALADESVTFEKWTLADVTAFHDDQLAEHRRIADENTTTEAFLEMRRYKNIREASAMTTKVRGSVAERRKNRTNKVSDRASQAEISRGGAFRNVGLPPDKAAAPTTDASTGLADQLRTIREQAAATNAVTQSPNLND